MPAILHPFPGAAVVSANRYEVYKGARTSGDPSCIPLGEKRYLSRRLHARIKELHPIKVERLA